MNGGAGRRVYGLDSTEATVAAASATAPAIASASAWPRAVPYTPLTLPTTAQCVDCVVPGPLQK